MKDCYLKQDRQERSNLKRGWFVNAYRLVDAEGHDLVQPWLPTKKEALWLANHLEYRVLGDFK